MTTARELPPNLHLAKGKHTNPDAGLSLMEAVAYVAGEEHTDHPFCASPILGVFGRELNDTFPDAKRQLLVPLVPRIVGTAGDGHDQERGLMAAVWLIRVYTPTWLRLAHFADAAASLEELHRLATWDDVAAAAPVVRKARDAAWDATGAAGAAPWAARAAARVATEDTAWAAGVAARDTTEDTAWAARVAARDTAWAAWAAGVAARAATEDAAWATGAAARDTAWAAWAARDATWAAWAAQAAARDATWAAWATGAAPWAARPATWDAAWDPTGAAPWAAAALQPTVDQVQDSAITLFGRMIEAHS